MQPSASRSPQALQILLGFKAQHLSPGAHIRGHFDIFQLKLQPTPWASDNGWAPMEICHGANWNGHTGMATNASDPLISTLHPCAATKGGGDRQLEKKDRVSWKVNAVVVGGGTRSRTSGDAVGETHSFFLLQAAGRRAGPAEQQDGSRAGGKCVREAHSFSLLPAAGQWAGPTERQAGQRQTQHSQSSSTKIRPRLSQCSSSLLLIPHFPVASQEPLLLCCKTHFHTDSSDTHNHLSCNKNDIKCRHS
ncbi:hypothetical protein NDU88_003892 [Pleurodeles waltl]|uniref:Uncharacterized protein n=1 Tax=Pleurodeles waltl TaxID=8319 RepID=A0AAV7VJ52_PLEWA|nr:hypothetical protein NDU88_003892 [Pleurodeles waltl]